MMGNPPATTYRVIPPGMEERLAAVRLIDCPFPLCDHHGGVPIDWEFVRRPDRDHWMYFAFCNSCNTRGPTASNPEEAAALWNERDPAKQVDMGP